MGKYEARNDGYFPFFFVYDEEPSQQSPSTQIQIDIDPILLTVSDTAPKFLLQLFHVMGSENKSRGYVPLIPPLKIKPFILGWKARISMTGLLIINLVTLEGQNWSGRNATVSLCSSDIHIVRLIGEDALIEILGG